MWRVEGYITRKNLYILRHCAFMQWTQLSKKPNSLKSTERAGMYIHDVINKTYYEQSE